MRRAPSLSRAAGLLAIANLVLILVLNGRPTFSSAVRLPRGIPSPVVALELARDVYEVDMIVGDKPSLDREVMRVKQYMDFPFIVAYWLLYLTMALLASSAPWGRWPAITAALAGTAAAICDVIENLAILRVLDADLAHTTQTMVDAIRRPSLVKWALTFAAVALLSSLLWSRSDRRMRAVGALFSPAALLGFYGLFDNAFLVWAGLPLLAGLVGVAVLFTPRTSP